MLQKEQTHAIIIKKYVNQFKNKNINIFIVNLHLLNYTN